MAEHGDREARALTAAGREIWDENADFWDAAMAEGNSFQRLLVGPATERLLGPGAGERILDVACGNGVFARRLAALGVDVVATDFSARLLELARARQTPGAAPIDYRQVDATDEARLRALGPDQFDGVVCSMALMDMAEIAPLARALRHLLKPDGRFVFSVPHPCFNTTGITKVVEETDSDGEIVTTYAVKVSGYLHLVPARGIAIHGQPTPHYYFDRPLHALLQPFLDAGLVMDALEEPAFDDAGVPDQPLEWANFREIPPVLVVRLRRLAAASTIGVGAPGASGRPGEERDDDRGI